MFKFLIRRTLDLKCRGDLIPPFVELDVSNLDLKDKIFADQMELPKGAEWVKLVSELEYNNFRTFFLICKRVSFDGNSTTGALWLL